MYIDPDTLIPAEMTTSNQRAQGRRWRGEESVRFGLGTQLCNYKRVRRLSNELKGTQEKGFQALRENSQVRGTTRGKGEF